MSFERGRGRGQEYGPVVDAGAAGRGVANDYESVPGLVDQEVTR